MHNMSKGHIKIRVHCFVAASRHHGLGTVMYIIMYSMFDAVGYQYTNCCGMPPCDFRLLMWRAEVLCSPLNAIQISLPRAWPKVPLTAEDTTRNSFTHVCRNYGNIIRLIQSFVKSILTLYEYLLWAINSTTMQHRLKLCLPSVGELPTGTQL